MIGLRKVHPPIPTQTKLVVLRFEHRDGRYDIFNSYRDARHSVPEISLPTSRACGYVTWLALAWLARHPCARLDVGLFDSLDRYSTPSVESFSPIIMISTDIPLKAESISELSAHSQADSSRTKRWL